jgi:NAD(P)-dependent dehydrogenase (short-subunit alcohol dehydrogenase family)
MSVPQGQKIAVIGGGRLGIQVALALKELGHNPVLFTHRTFGQSKKHQQRKNALEKEGISLITFTDDDFKNPDTIKRFFQRNGGNFYAVVNTGRLSPENLKKEQDLIKASASAGVQRFSPLTPFVNAPADEMGYLGSFLAESRRLLRETENLMPWSSATPGFIGDWMLPFDSETNSLLSYSSPSDWRREFYASSLPDLAQITALNLFNDKVKNKNVQMDFEKTSQENNLKLLQEAWGPGSKWKDQNQVTNISKDQIMQRYNDALATRPGTDQSADKSLDIAMKILYLGSKGGQTNLILHEDEHNASGRSKYPNYQLRKELKEVFQEMNVLNPQTSSTTEQERRKEAQEGRMETEQRQTVA